MFPVLISISNYVALAFLSIALSALLPLFLAMPLEIGIYLFFPVLSHAQYIFLLCRWPRTTAFQNWFRHSGIWRHHGIVPVPLLRARGTPFRRKACVRRGPDGMSPDLRFVPNYQRNCSTGRGVAHNMGPDWVYACPWWSDGSRVRCVDLVPIQVSLEQLINIHSLFRCHFHVRASVGTQVQQRYGQRDVSDISLVGSGPRPSFVHVVVFAFCGTPSHGRVLCLLRILRLLHIRARARGTASGGDLG